MGRNKYTHSHAKYPENKYSKGRYKLNHNGVPLDDNDNRVMNTHKFHHKKYNKVGRYRPTAHNISDI